MPARNSVTAERWEQAVDAFELGLQHAYEIAADVGVSPQTVMREMKRRGAVKGSRVNESIEDLVVRLDRKAKAAALMGLSDSQRRRRVAEANGKAVGDMIAALLDADRQGDMSMASPLIDRVGTAVGSKRRRRA
jgi:hypothetical protein